MTSRSIMDRKCKSLVDYTTESSDDEDCNEKMHAAKLKLKEWVDNDSDLDANFETENNDTVDHDTSDSEDTKELTNKNNTNKYNEENQNIVENAEANVKEYITGVILNTIAVKNWDKANRIYTTMLEEFGLQKLSRLSEDVILDKAKAIITNKMQVKRRHICNYCLKKFKNKKDCCDHVRMIHEKFPKPFHCEFCEKCYMSDSALRYHTEVVHSDACPRVKCSLCDRSFGHKTNLKRHMQTHEKDIVKHQCDHCDKEFLRMDLLVRHRKNKHRKVELEADMIENFKENEKFRCKDCHEVLDDKSDMVVHLMDKCKVKQCFSCSDCGRKFISKFNLERHIKNVHSNDLPTFSCETCHFITRFKENLNRHVIRKHTIKD